MEEQLIAVLKEGEAGLPGVRKYGVTEHTFYRRSSAAWRSNEATRLRSLEDETRRLHSAPRPNVPAYRTRLARIAPIGTDSQNEKV